MRHIDEKRLTLFHYGEATDDEAQAVRMHLVECERCAEEYSALAATLGALDGTPLPELPADYGRRVWRDVRLRASRPRRAGIGLPRLALGSAVALLLVVAFLAGRHFGDDAGAALGEPARQRILLVTVGDHLERSERLLVDLVNTPPEPGGDLSRQKLRAAELAAENRLYRRTADGAGEQQLAALLDELERFLIELANSPALLTSGEFRDLKRRAEKHGLLVKVRLLGRDTRERGRRIPRAQDEI